jgi:hypothetical protein
MIIEFSAKGYKGYSFEIDLAKLVDSGESDVLQLVKCRRLFAAGRVRRSTVTTRRACRIYGHQLHKKNKVG